MHKNLYEALHRMIDELQELHEAELKQAKVEQRPTPPPAPSDYSGGYDGRKLLSHTELAQYLGIGKNKAFDLLHTEGFPTIRFGKRIFADREKLDAWLDAKGGQV